MRAAICPRLGPPEVVAVQDVDPPVLSPGAVRVRVGAAAVNFPDVLLVAGSYQMSVPVPFVPGSELAGVVTEVGDRVTSVAVGDRVFGAGLVGAFAEEVVLPAATLTAVPDGVDLTSVAAFGVAHRTAYHALRSVAELRAGDELVVLGAGGGVGLATVQLGSVLGARVTAVASSQDKLAAATDAGAAATVLHGRGDGSPRELREALRAAVPDGADVVIDPVGGDLSEPALRSMRWGGRFVTVGYASGTIPSIPLNLVLLKGVRVAGFQMIDLLTHRPDEVERNERELLGLLASGRAVPHIGARFPLEAAAEALRLVADGGAVGKVVIDIAALD